MTFEFLLTAALDIAFFALVVLTLASYLRERTAVARDTFLLFASVAVVLAVPLVRQVFPGLPPIVATLAAVFLLAQPALTLLLISHFREGMRPLVVATFVLFVLSSIALVAIRPPLPLPVTLGVVAYFVVVNLIAAVLFALEARRRIGGGRTRLALASAGSVLFGVAILVAASGAVLRPAAASATAQADPLITTVSRILALLAAVCYLAAFAPPARLRHAWQRSVAYEYLRDLVLTPPDGDRDALWGRLTLAARRVTGARASAVAVGPAGGDVGICAVDGEWTGTAPNEVKVPQAALAASAIRGTKFGREVDRSEPGIARLVESAGARSVISLPVEVDRDTQGALLLFANQSPLFVQDDLALLGVLVAHTARAVQRETALQERTVLVDQLRRINAELSHASSAKSDFLAAMSHELRTPLHAIIGFSELLVSPGDAGDGADPTVKEFAGHIHGAGLHLLDLINDVLDMAKVEAGRLDLHQETFDLSALAHRTVRTMQPLAAKKRIALSLPAASGIQVRADAARMRQILFNLVSNAVKFTPEKGRVDVTIETRDSEVRLSVTDTGRGIAPADQARIFEPFEQTEHGDAGQEGTGLGLALTRQLVEAHGGRIELDSEPGRGSRFTVILPASSQPSAEVPPTPALSTTAVRTDAPLVLVAEDDPRAAELLTIHLKTAGYAVAVATDGASALAEARRLQPAAIVLDIILPVLDGWEVLRQLKADPATEALPVVIASVIEDAEIGFALGAVDYLVKPIKTDVLLAELERVAVGDPARRGGLTVLAIDDDPAALELYRAELQPRGFTVLAATDGEAGLRVAADRRPDVILLDLLMPGIDGWEVARRLQADPATQPIPILVVTSHDLTREEKERLNGGVREVVQKGPDGPNRLLRWLAKIDRNRTAAARSTTGPDPEPTATAS